MKKKTNQQNKTNAGLKHEARVILRLKSSNKKYVLKIFKKYCILKLLEILNT